MRTTLLLLLTLSFLACGKSGSESATPDAKPAPEQPKPTVGDKPRACPTGTPYDQCRSFLMKLTGRNGKPPGANDLKYVTGVIGGLVTRLKVLKYDLLERYPDGGFRACLDPSPDGGYEAAVNEFTVFRVGSETQWDVSPALGCSGGD